MIVVTEVQESQKSEVASKIVWTTPRSTTTTKKGFNTSMTTTMLTTTKESVDDDVETVPSKRMTGTTFREITIRTTELSPLEIITTGKMRDE